MIGALATMNKNARQYPLTVNIVLMFDFLTNNIFFMLFILLHIRTFIVVIDLSTIYIQITNFGNVHFWFLIHRE